MKITLKEARKKACLTQAEVAQKLGISRATYGNYEAKRQNMTIDKFVKFCQLTNESMENISIG